MSILYVLYLTAFAVPPILLGITWWGWFRSPHMETPKGPRFLFFAGLCASTANCVLWWAWVAWLQLHYNNPGSWKVQDKISNLGLCLLLFALIAATAGAGKHRRLLIISSVLAFLPWIPLGIL